MKKKIYVVEDDKDIREIIEFFLDAEGMEAHTYSHIADFKRDCNSMGNADLFLLDVNLPDGSGVDLAAALSKNPDTYHVPVLIMSAHLNNGFAFSENVRSFLPKPFDLNDMASQIKQYVYA
ncbi:response regulator [Olivibacter sp. SDN3]|uniref:response regulator n=1 Tax=Olivibacter sp. SDN3 TaxID=2764720 RepID=UPI0016516EB7|nr:response regulator [Olivibacter sp. SDN3]QNL51690.1 response regulator [Olivibacter sp. SDN3]